MNLIRRNFRYLPKPVFVWAVVGLAFWLTACSKDSSELTISETESETLPSDAAPAIAFRERIHDFGKVTVGDQLPVSFEFSNQGGTPLEILDVDSACACTSNGAWTKVVAPGDTGVIPVRLDTTHFDGRLSKAITVRSNDPNNPVSRLTVSANVWSPVKVTPAYASFGLLGISDPARKKTVRVYNQEEAPLALTDISINSDSFKVDLRTIQEGKEYAIDILTVPPLKKGVQVGTLTLTTTSLLKPRISIPVTANVVGKVSIAPAEIVLSPTPLKEAVTKTVTVRSLLSNQLKVTEAEFNLPEVATAIREIRPRQIYQIDITFPVGFRIDHKLSDQVQLVIRTDSRSQPLLRVPVILEGSHARESLGTGNVEKSSEPLSPCLDELAETGLHGLSVAPKIISFGVIPGDAAQQRVVRIQNRSALPIEFEKPVSSNAAFEARIEAVTPSKAYKLIIQSGPGLAQGVHRGEITVKTTNPEWPNIEVPVHALVRPAMERRE